MMSARKKQVALTLLAAIMVAVLAAGLAFGFTNRAYAAEPANLALTATVNAGAFQSGGRDESKLSPVATLNDGNRGVLPGSGWSSCGWDSAPALQGSVVVSWDAPQTFNFINVFTLDNTTGASVITKEMTCDTWGVSDFQIYAFNGTDFGTEPVGSVTGNNKVWIEVPLSETVTTTKLWFDFTGGRMGSIRLMELEAFNIESNFQLLKTSASLEQYSSSGIEIPTKNVNAEEITVENGSSVLSAGTDYSYAKDGDKIIRFSPSYLKTLPVGTASLTVKCGSAAETLVFTVGARLSAGGFAVQSGAGGTVSEENGIVTIAGLDSVGNNQNVFALEGYPLGNVIKLSLKVDTLRDADVNELFTVVFGNSNTDYTLLHPANSGKTRDNEIAFNGKGTHIWNGQEFNTAEFAWNDYYLLATETADKTVIKIYNERGKSETKEFAKGYFKDGKVYVGVFRATGLQLKVDSAPKTYQNDGIGLYSPRQDNEIKFDLVYRGSSLTVKNGNAAVDPANYAITEKDGYSVLTFTKAYVKSLPAGDTVLSLATELETVPLALTIRIATPVTLKFYNEAGTEEIADAINEEVGYQITFPESPVRLGYRFAGWRTAANGAGERFTSSVMPTASMSLYASFEIAPMQIIFDYDGADGNSGTLQISVTINTAVGTLPSPTKTNYSFAGWFDSEGKEYKADTVYTLGGGITLKAKWTLSPTFKTSAKAELDAFASELKQKNYTAENWALIQEKLAAGKAAIDKAGTIDEVIAAKASAKSAVNDIPKAEQSGDASVWIAVGISAAVLIAGGIVLVFLKKRKKV